MQQTVKVENLMTNTVNGVSMCGPCYEMGHAAQDYVQNCSFFS